MDFFKHAFDAETLLNGQVLLMDKPMGWSSFQVVNKVRWHIKNSCDLKKIKVGHAGTLDPLATGLLVLCTGKMTKSIQTFMGADKEYTGTFTLGATTPSYDLETEINQRFDYAHVDSDFIHKTVQHFTGNIRQQPPLYSALKKDGKRLYELARAGETTSIPKREVQIHAFEITRIQLPEIDFKIRCSKGTYIRSIAHDFGKALGSGAHLTALRRTKSGEFDVKEAFRLEA